MAKVDTLPAPDSDARDHVRAVVEASATSFLMGMRVLPASRREAMFAIYAFCREVDDVADDEGPESEKLTRLAEWRAEVERLYAGDPRWPTTRALAEIIPAYQLPKAEFLALIDGMEMDVNGAMCAPTWQELLAYCRRVAGAVGMLSVRVFGAREPEADELAVTLGEALQLTNILRDLPEDAQRGRLYLPRELMAQHGIDHGDIAAVLRHPALPAVAAELAATARGRFDRSRELLALCDRRRLKPAVLMMEVYDRILKRLEARGWERIDEPVRVPRIEKLWIALRHGLF